jgi:DNA-binding MarR family transcriptional regulator
MGSSRLSDVEARAWQALLHAHHDIVEALDRELRDAHGITFGEYDVLLRLGRAPDRALRMSDLADRVMLSASGVTRLVDRLAVRGLLERRTEPADARVALASLTIEGSRLLRRAARTHLLGIRTHFTSRLTEAQLRAVAAGLEQVAGPHEPH